MSSPSSDFDRKGFNYYVDHRPRKWAPIKNVTTESREWKQMSQEERNKWIKKEEKESTEYMIFEEYSPSGSDEMFLIVIQYTDNRHQLKKLLKYLELTREYEAGLALPRCCKFSYYSKPRYKYREAKLIAKALSKINFCGADRTTVLIISGKIKVPDRHEGEEKWKWFERIGEWWGIKGKVRDLALKKEKKHNSEDETDFEYYEQKCNLECCTRQDLFGCENCGYEHNYGGICSKCKDIIVCCECITNNGGAVVCKNCTKQEST